MSDDNGKLKYSHALMVTHLQALDNKEALEPDPDCPMCRLAASARAQAFEEAAKIADEQFGAIQRDPDDYIGKQRHSDSWDQCATRIAAAIREHARK